MKHYIDFKIGNALSGMQRFLEEFPLQMDSINLSPTSLRKVKLVVEEILTNIIKYGYIDKRDGLIELRIIPNRKSLSMEISDDGIPFDPTLAREYREPTSVSDLKIGGLGLILVKKSCIRMKYKRDGNKNILNMTIAVSFK